jgi:hypothetical protein
MGMRKLFWACLCLTGAMPAAVISDSVFNNADWTATMVSLGGASSSSFTITQAPAGGNTGPYRSDVHSMSANNPVYTAISIFNRYVPVQLDLSGSGLSSITYSWDVRLDGGTTSSVAYRLALQQGGNVYHTVGAAQGAVNGNWTANGATFTNASSFCLATSGFFSGNDTHDCSQNPDFAQGAGNISVGYVIGNSFGGNANGVGNYESGLDNFQITTVGGVATPEPGSVALGLTGLAMTFLGFRRRQRVRVPSSR